jgi:para-aminobenzoate synthetase/4-amino-4-deoxychorismate lyase
MRAIFFDPETRKWLNFSGLTAVIQADTHEQVTQLLSVIAHRSETENLYAAGFLCYEASAAFDPHFETRGGTASLPLALFALYMNRDEYFTLDELAENTGLGVPASCATKYSVGPFIADMDKCTYLEKIAAIKRYIEKGDTYQINFTFRMEAAFSGSAFAWFRDLASEKPGNYLAFIENENFAFCSFSPELFFAKSGTELTLKPMKGTAPRNTGRDETDGEALRTSVKNRAENLMIVDMIRNDIGRVAETGTVEVPSLFDIEFYPTVIQMTSTVTAQVEATFPRIFASLFPCASITGAPKIRSMKIIRELETGARGIYTGTMGYLTPGGDCLFNVAIRTGAVAKKAHSVRYGTGSGIVWGSVASDEWEECMAKTAILEGKERFYVFESILLEEGSYFLLERHLLRMEKACLFFGIPFAENDARARLNGILAETATLHPTGSWKVRITADGKVDPAVECDTVPVLAHPYTCRLSSFQVDPCDPFLAFKTCRRRHVEDALSEANGASDVFLVNTRGELTESTRANIVLELDGGLFTPVSESGLLCGVYRDELIACGELREKVLHPADIARASKVYIINSVRRLVECTVI